MKLSQLHPNEGQIAGVPRNPRQIREAEFRKLKQSLQTFRSMLEARPIVVDEDWNILGGNMRYQALLRLAEEKAKVRGFEFTEDIPDAWIKQVTTWTAEQKAEFVIKDNNEFGEYDWDMIANEWTDLPLEDWGVDVPEFGEKETERLSEIEVNSIYHEPENRPELTLDKCVDLTKYHVKMNALREMNLPENTLAVLELFARRFIRIDFESVANYYAFNATGKEKEAIERLRLVLVDGGINGFIEDDLLHIREEFLQNIGEDE